MLNEIEQIFKSDNHNFKKGNTKQIDNVNEILWVEKYRPKTIDNIIQQTEVVKVLQNTLKTGELPHLIFFGPPGTGKTSTILAMAMQLYGPNIIQDRVLELNASDDRGISIVRNDIITFAKISIGSKDPDYPCPDFKLVILDEADAMTPEAQAALRKIMEKMSEITRFCFICNYINQIIDPISSRCMKFRFKPIGNTAIINKMREISHIEMLDVSDNCLDTIADIAKGDARRAIMLLQNLQYIKKHKKQITPSDILDISGIIRKETVESFWNLCLNGTTTVIRNIALDIKRNGYSVRHFLTHINNLVISSNMTDKQKADILLEICKSDRRLIEGSNEYVQILNILFYINKISNT